MKKIKKTKKTAAKTPLTIEEIKSWTGTKMRKEIKSRSRRVEIYNLLKSQR